MSVVRWVGGGKGAYRQRVRLDGQHAVMGTNCLNVVRIAPEHSIGIAHHPAQHGPCRWRHGTLNAVEEGGGGKRVIGRVVQEGGTRAGGRVN